jgi:hypothetical protein
VHRLTGAAKQYGKSGGTGGLGRTPFLIAYNEDIHCLLSLSESSQHPVLKANLILALWQAINASFAGIYCFAVIKTFMVSRICHNSGIMALLAFYPKSGGFPFSRAGGDSR